MSSFWVCDKNYNPIVEISREGKITIADGVSVDDAAREFWNAVEKQAQHARASLLSTRELGPELVRLGLIPKKTTRVMFDLAPDSPVRMYYEVLADRTLLDVFPALAAAALADRERAANEWEEHKRERAERVNEEFDKTEDATDAE